MNNCYPKMAFAFLTSRLSRARRIASGALLAGLLLAWLPALADSPGPIGNNPELTKPEPTGNNPAQPANAPLPQVETPGLKPYSAVYTSTLSGFSADMDQRLSRVGEDRWQLSNKASFLFAGFEESAVFTVESQTVRPLRYDYDNKLSKNHSSQVRFNWDNDTFIDKLHSKKPEPLNGRAWDQLSLQAQLRLILLKNSGHIDTTVFPEIDRYKIKQYTVKKLGEEQLQTDLGTFTAVKLEERRVNRDDHTLIWLAKDWDYLILRLQRIEEGKVEFEINLKQATLDGDRNVEGH